MIRIISVEKQPIEGTLMHRRMEGKWPVSPEYRGSDLEAAKRDAFTIGVKAFWFDGHTYELIEGQWYKLVLS